jgi:beta-ureidopropionase / N-carbamoyl-L-amino-acid hydrolase
VTVSGLLTQIAAIGRDGGTGGYRRFAFTAEDAMLGEWFAASCAARGLTVTVDRCGNQWAWWGDPDAAGPAGGIVTGSHLDSVPDGGGYDGPLGVACALTALDLLQASGFRPTRPIGVVRFVDEEGARFGLACSGSRLLTGQSAAGRVLGLTDAAGTSYADAMASAGLAAEHAGRDDETLRRVGAFVELHVEQGRGLALDAGEPGAPEGGGAAVGVASAIRPHGRWRVDLAGTADHAGTTALADRDDPMLELARLVTAVRAAGERDGDRGTVGTVGKLLVRPNAVNAVPSLVQAWLDVRADSEQQVRAVLTELERAGFGPVEESWTGAVAMDAGLRDRLATVVGAALGHGGPAPVLPTGAGHDAGILAAAGIPSGMLFVRNPSGVSHSPAEHAPDADCEAGAVALAAVLADLASSPPP